MEALLYLFAIGLGIGSYVHDINGIPYVNFIAPAILAIAVMNSAFFECTYGSYVRMYYQKSFDAMIATPLSIEDVIAGELLWGATRAVIYVIIMLPVLAAFGVISLPLALFAIPFGFLGGLMFAGIAMCFTAISPGYRHPELSLVPLHHPDVSLLGHVLPPHPDAGRSPVHRVCRPPAHPPRCDHADVHPAVILVDDPCPFRVDCRCHCILLPALHQPDETTAHCMSSGTSGEKFQTSLHLSTAADISRPDDDAIIPAREESG